MAKLTPRITQVTLTPGELFHENAWTITVLDEAAGEFLEVMSVSDGSAIRIDVNEWNVLRDQISRMFTRVVTQTSADEDELLDAQSVCMGGPDNEGAPYVPSGGWIPWDGGEECPVDKYAHVAVRYRDGGESIEYGREWVWHHNGDFDDIIAYKVVG